MIKHIHLTNLILVESCHLEFKPHFTALTGETGAGKTALIEAIALVLGARADTSLIRKQCDSASVETAFDIDSLPATQALLHTLGIPFEKEEYLIIRREITKEGKNRAFINCQMVPLSVLQKVGATLLELISQNSAQELYNIDFQRQVVDLFGDTAEDLKIYQTSWEIEKQLKSDLTSLLSKEMQKEREEALLLVQIQEIESVNLKEKEEEELSQEHTRLSHSQEIHEKMGTLLHYLKTAVPQVSRFHKTLENLSAMDPFLAETTTLLKEASIILSESENNLQHYVNKLDNNPKRFTYLEERLSAIHRLKRKYGTSFSEIQTFYLEMKEKCTQLETLGTQIEETQQLLKAATENTLKYARDLTEKRKQSAILLEEKIIAHIHQLNMQNAEIQIRLTLGALQSSGQDCIEFWMRANIGENAVPIKEHASGGEICRLLFAIKLTLAEKNNTPTLIFDEIDSNVGGRTASIIGLKLKELGLLRQVICITHFPQVASQAHNHISVQKTESQERTLTTITALNKGEKETELLRMLGHAY